MPEFPQIKFDLGFRKTISKEIQWSILEEVKRLTWAKNPHVSSTEVNLNNIT